MADTNIIIGGDTRQLERDIQATLSKDFKLKGFDAKSFSQPLGKIRGQLGEFEKSLEASNARVVAFGASAGSVYLLTDAFKSMIQATISVEKNLADINTVLNVSEKDIKSFGNTIFDVANKTSQSFEIAADAALEFSRQGLGLEETAKRTADALTLARLSGLSAASSVEALTAAINSYGDASLNTTQIVNKLAAVDARYAVSSADLAEAIKRVGSSASEAGVNIDELIALVTSAQQTTARGGAVIGNSFKTIFTRLQRPKVLEDLRELGIQTSNAIGETLPLVQILSQLARSFDNLGSAQKSQVAELVGGVYQINILKAVLGDLSKSYSVYGGALKTSSGATNEAQTRIAQLGQTVDSQVNRITNNLKRAGSVIGELTIVPALERVLSGANAVLETFALGKEPQTFGEKAATGFLKGLGSFISGPGLLLGATAAFQIFKRLATFVGDAGKTVLGLGQAAQQQAQIQAQILQLLQRNPQLYAQIESGAVSVQSAAQGYLAIVNATNAALERQKTLAGQIASAVGPNAPIVMGDVGAARPTKSSGKKTRAGGYIPSDVKTQEKMGAMMGGYKSGKVVKAPSSVGGVMNTAETVKYVPGFAQPFINPPKDSKAGREHRKNAEKMTGVDPYSANGFVPNFVDKKKQISINREMGRLFEEKVGADIGVPPSWNEAVDFKKVLKVPTDISKQYNKNIYDSNVFADAHSGLGHDNATTIGKVIRHLDLSYKKIALGNNDDFFIDSGKNIILIPDFVEIIGKGNDKEEFFSSKVSSLKADSKSLFLQGLTKKEQEEISKQKISLEFFKDKVNVDYASKGITTESGPSKKQTKQKLPKKYKSNGFVPNFAYVKSMIARVIPNTLRPLTDTKGTAFKNTNIGRARQGTFQSYDLTDEQVLSQAQLNYPNLIMSVLGNNAFIPDIDAVDKQSAGAQVYSAANIVSSFGNTTANKPGQYNPFGGGGAYKSNPELIGTGFVQGKALKMSYANVGKLGRRWENSKDPAVKNAWANLQKYSKMKLIYKARTSYAGEEGSAFLNENSRRWYADDIDKELRKNSEILKTEYNNYLKSINRIGTYVDIKGSAEATLFGKDVNYMALRPDVLSRQIQGLPKFDWKTAANGIFYGDYKNNKAQYDRLAELMGQKWNYVADKKRMFMQSGGFIPNFAAGDGSISLEEYMTMKYGEQKPLTSLGGAALNAAYGKGVSLEEIKKKVGAVNPKYLNWTPGGATTALRETQKENRIQAQKEFTRKYGFRKIILPWNKTIDDFGGDAKKFGQAYENLVGEKFGGKRPNRFKSANEYGVYGANPITPMFNTTAVDFINPKSATDLSLGGTLIEARGGDKKNYNPSDISKKFEDFFNQNPSYDPKKWKRVLISRNAAGFIPNFNAVQEAVGREMSAGYSRSQVKIGKSNKLKTSFNPMGLGVYNSPEGSLSKGISLAEKAGINPKTKGMASGFVPNFAKGKGKRAKRAFNDRVNPDDYEKILAEFEANRPTVTPEMFEPAPAISRSISGKKSYAAPKGGRQMPSSLAPKTTAFQTLATSFPQKFYTPAAPVSESLGTIDTKRRSVFLASQETEMERLNATQKALDRRERKLAKDREKRGGGGMPPKPIYSGDLEVINEPPQTATTGKQSSQTKEKGAKGAATKGKGIKSSPMSEMEKMSRFNRTLATTMAISGAVGQAQAFGLIDPESAAGQMVSKGSEFLNLGLTAKDLYSEYAPTIGKKLAGTRLGQSAIGRGVAGVAGRLGASFGGMGALGPLAAAYGAGKIGQMGVDYLGLPGGVGTKDISKEREDAVKELEKFKTETGKSISAYSSAMSSKYGGLGEATGEKVKYGIPGFGVEEELQKFDIGAQRREAVQKISGELGGIENVSRLLKESGGVGMGKGSADQFTKSVISNLQGLGKEVGDLADPKNFGKAKDLAAGLIAEVNKFEKFKSINQILSDTSTQMSTLAGRATMMLTVYRELEKNELQRGETLKKNFAGGAEGYFNPNKSADSMLNINRALKTLNDPRLARNQMERGRAAQQYLTSATEMGIDIAPQVREQLSKIMDAGLKQYQAQNLNTLMRIGGGYRNDFGLQQGMLRGLMGTGAAAGRSGLSIQEAQLSQNQQAVEAGYLNRLDVNAMGMLGNPKAVKTFQDTAMRIKQAESDLNRLAQGVATGRVSMQEFQKVSGAIQTASRISEKDPQYAQTQALAAIEQAFKELSQQSQAIAKFGEAFAGANNINLSGNVNVGLTPEAVGYLKVAEAVYKANNKPKEKEGTPPQVTDSQVSNLGKTYMNMYGGGMLYN